MRENSSVSTKIRWGGENEVLQVLEYNFLCGPWWSKHFSAVHGGWHQSTSTLQPVEDPVPLQVDMPWRKLQHMERSYWSRLLAGLAAHEEVPVQEMMFCQSLWPMSTHAGAGCSLWTVYHGQNPFRSRSWRITRYGKGPCWRSLWKTLSYRKDPTLEERIVRRKDPQRQHYGLNIVPLSSILHAAEGKRQKSKELSFKKRRESWFLFFSFVSHNPTLLLSDNKLNKFSPNWISFA